MQVTDAKPGDEKSLDRSVVALTIVIWLAHLLTMLTLSRAIAMNVDMGATLARVVASTFGVGVTLAIYLLLRLIKPHRPWYRLLMATALSLPACALQTFVNELAFHELALSYQQDPGKWLRPEEFAFTFLFFLWVFIAWSALYASAANAADVRRRDRELAVAKSSAQEAQLLALRLQVSPHFLFNTLNTLSGLTALGRAHDSEQVIQNLSHFLRYTLDSSPHQLVTLADEISVQRMYLEIEKTRFPDRLRVNSEIPSACNAALVPSLILLPLVENAVKHGLGMSEGEVSISLGANRVADTLVVWIRHDGGTPSPPCANGLGIGLRNVRERITTSFGPEFTLQAAATADGWRSAITIPWMERKA